MLAKAKKAKRLVILDKEGTRQVFENYHGRTEGRPPLRKAATTFSFIGKLSIDVLNFVRIFVSNDLLFLDRKLYYVGKSKTDKRLVILDEEGKKQVFEDCHGSKNGSGKFTKVLSQ